MPPDSSERPVTVSQGGGAREAFFQAMNEWFVSLFVRIRLLDLHPLMILRSPM
ncbi:hypothetical protein Gotur_026743 [Gossypium turneri]